MTVLLDVNAELGKSLVGAGSVVKDPFGWSKQVISETVDRVLDAWVIGNAPLATATEIPHSEKNLSGSGRQSGKPCALDRY